MAASKTLLVFLMLTLLILLSTPSQSQAQKPSRLDRVNKVMTENGFEDMAEMLVSMHSDLFPDLENLELDNKTYTVFAPGTPSFWARSNDDPSLSLIRYHVVPFKVDHDLVGSSSMNGLKLDTLFQGHPLVITTGSLEGWNPYPSINLVPVGPWNVYNDGHLIVHGLPEFFDSKYEADRYPLFKGAPASSPTIAKISSGCFEMTPHGILSLLSLPVVICLLFFF